MKRTLIFVVGICSVVAASAVGFSEQSNNAGASGTSVADPEFGLVAVEKLTVEQRAVLQAKYRHWAAATSYVAPKEPI